MARVKSFKTYDLDRVLIFQTVRYRYCSSMTRELWPRLCILVFDW